MSQWMWHGWAKAGAAVSVVLLCGWNCMSASAPLPVNLPWSVAAATARQVFEIQAIVPRRDVAVTLTLDPGVQSLPGLLLLDEGSAALPLPYYHEDDGSLVVVLGGDLLPGVPRHVVAYLAAETLPGQLPLLERHPLSGDDYATVVHGDAWDFEEGDQENIRSWGDRPQHYGEVTVTDGWLRVPVTGSDAYFIWGVMFGNPTDQPDGHGDQSEERIDSGVYRMLTMRLKQSCASSKWSFYMTESSGPWHTHDFRVEGTGTQTFSFDLAELFGDAWDGRPYRALRIDLINDVPGTTAEIDWVSLTPAPPTVTSGPLLTQALARTNRLTTDLRVEAPETAPAGHEVPITVQAPADAFPLLVSLRYSAPGAATPTTVSHRVEAADASIPLPVGTIAGDGMWELAPSDDLGRPAAAIRRGRLRIMPGPLHHYELIPALRFVPVTAPTTTLDVWSCDRYGNRFAATVPNPFWTVSRGGKVMVDVLQGNPAVVPFSAAPEPCVRHDIVLQDGDGVQGVCQVITVGYRANPLHLNAAGYLQTQAGEVVFPMGGFYANWPSGAPDANGQIHRSVDLFPCNVVPYPHGFPWSAEVEAKVETYLATCKENGVTALRLMLRNVDVVGRVDQEQLQAVLHLFDLGREAGLRFNVVLFEDYDKPPYCNMSIIETIALPKYTDAELAALPSHRRRFLVDKAVLPDPALRYSDADAMACQMDYLADLIPVLAGRDEVLCYELENEMVHPPMAWVNTISAAIRRIDPFTPILGNPGDHSWPEPWRWRGSEVDLFSYHPYNDGMDGADHGAVIFMRSAWAAAAGIPFYTGEGGINQNRWQADITKLAHAYTMRGIRDQIWLSFCYGANGAFMWGIENRWEMAEFGGALRALKSLDIGVGTWPRRTPETVLMMPKDAAANRLAYLTGWKLLSLGVDFDARPSGATDGYTTILEPGAEDDELRVAPALVHPWPGYQAAVMVSEDERRALVYLRNVAGGIRAFGAKRPCYVREPEAAEVGLETVGQWTSVTAYDLDDDRAVLPQSGAQGWRIGVRSAHDFVVGLKR